MNITIKEVNGCPTMMVTKGNISFVYSGMDFILYKAIIKLENATIDGKDFFEVTNEEVVSELEEKVLTEKENMQINRMAVAYSCDGLVYIY